MAELLDDEALRTALDGLDGWHGDRAAISRTVTVPAGEQPALLEEMERVARELNHDPDLDIAGDKVTIMMSTHSAGGVTKLDVEYAHRVDGLLAATS
ncbi:MAG TPA: 4a-hydroxytetrahydrobiopterin dehydratase [Mycobacteriales bacterium]|nr:4a-hydroxytetrahydrobiopterin dehydratase [Mycobacteriales bacterium]